MLNTATKNTIVSSLFFPKARFTQCPKIILRSLTTLLFSGLMLYQQTIEAGSSTGTMLVSATVAAKCLVNDSALNFGTYDPLNTHASTPLTTVGSMNLRCTKNSAATVTLSAGNHAGNATGTTRAMTNSASDNYLSYELYTNSSYTTVWNDTNGVTQVAASSATPTVVNIYGKILPNQDVKDGAYSDTIIVTANF